MPKRRDIRQGNGASAPARSSSARPPNSTMPARKRASHCKEEGYEVVLVNSNPATIMTDTHIADKVYMEPLTLEYVAKIIRFERPDAIVPGLGGQTGLNLAVQLARKGILEECQVEILGTSFETIERAEDRELFKDAVPVAGRTGDRI